MKDAIHPVKITVEPVEATLYGIPGHLTPSCHRAALEDIQPAADEDGGDGQMDRRCPACLRQILMPLFARESEWRT
jgi:hypothetical protein